MKKPQKLVPAEWQFSAKRIPEDAEWYHCLLYEYARYFIGRSPELRSLVQELAPLAVEFAGDPDPVEIILEIVERLGAMVGAPLLHRDMVAVPWLDLPRSVRKKEVAGVNEIRNAPQLVDKKGLPVEGAKGFGGLISTGNPEHLNSLSEFRTLCEKTAPDQLNAHHLSYGFFRVDWNEPDTRICDGFAHWLAVQRELKGSKAKKAPIDRIWAQTGLQALGWRRLKEAGCTFPQIEDLFAEANIPPFYATPSAASNASNAVFLETMDALFRNFRSIAAK